MTQLASAVPTIDVEFPTNELMASPFAFYERVRELGPVVRLDTSQPEFLVTRHAAVFEALKRRDVFLNSHSVVDDGYVRRATLDDIGPDRIAAMVAIDPPEHTGKRRVAFTAVKPGRLRTYEETIRRHADRLIDTFADRGEVELVTEFCMRYPSGIIAELLGLPEKDRDRLIHWSTYEGHGAIYQSMQRRDDAAAIVRELGAYCTEVVTERLEHPQDDMISLLAQRQAEVRGELHRAHLIADVSNLLIGGILTSAHMIASAMLLLQRHPDQLDAVKADQDLLRNALEETIRIESPVQWQPRLVKHDTELAGVPIPAGAMLLVLYASANRDPRKFTDPDRFDVTRADAIDHLGFGYGVHFCLGAPLARLEGRIAFEQLFARLPNVRLADEQPDTRPIESLTFRGPRALRLVFDPAS